MRKVDNSALGNPDELNDPALTKEESIAEIQWIERMEAWDLSQQMAAGFMAEDDQAEAEEKPEAWNSCQQKAASQLLDQLKRMFFEIKESPDRVRLLNSVDRLIQMRESDPLVQFGPKHQWAEPLVSMFADNLEGWATYVRAIWEPLPKRSFDSQDLRERCLRRIELRLDARVTRARFSRLLQACVTKFGPFKSPKAESRYVHKVGALWSAQRRDLLAGVRNATPNGKLTADQMRRLTISFWLIVDEKIDKGDIPDPG